jgi:hypothetical protein
LFAADRQVLGGRCNAFFFSRAKSDHSGAVTTWQQTKVISIAFAARFANLRRN